METFQGAFVSGQKSGQASYCSPEGDVYQGEFEQDLMDGTGLLIYKKHPVYFAFQGDFSKDKFKGNGFLWLRSGEVLEAQFERSALKSKPHDAKILYPNGDLYTGKLDNFLRSGGRGKMMYQDSGIIYEGTWLKDQRDGLGVINNPDGSFFKAKFDEDQIKEITSYTDKLGNVFSPGENGKFVN